MAQGLKLLIAILFQISAFLTLLKAVTLEVSQAVYYMKINCLISCELAEKKKREKKTIPLRIKEIMVFFSLSSFFPTPSRRRSVPVRYLTC